MHGEKRSRDGVFRHPKAGGDEASYKGSLARGVGRKPGDQDSLALGSEQVPQGHWDIAHWELLRVRGTKGYEAHSEYNLR